MIDALDAVDGLCQEWAATHGIQFKPMLHAPRPDATGCQRLQNFPTYPIFSSALNPTISNASGQPARQRFALQQWASGALLVSMHWSASALPHGLLMLSVLSDGEPITTETERSLFEPFSRPVAGARAWACIFAESCANVMVRTLTTANTPLASATVTNSSSRFRLSPHRTPLFNHDFARLHRLLVVDDEPTCGLCTN